MLEYRNNGVLGFKRITPLLHHSSNPVFRSEVCERNGIMELWNTEVPGFELINPSFHISNIPIFLGAGDED
jgi:hypothetical protein